MLRPVSADTDGWTREHRSKIRTTGGEVDLRAEFDELNVAGKRI